MKRRQKTPWIHRWSRVIIGAIATVGAILTAYLTVAKLSGAGVACTGPAETASGSCDLVLSSPYATVFGLPLALFGCLAYLSMISFALSPYLINEEKNKDLRTTVEQWTGVLLLMGAAAMATFSSYLMYVLAFKIQASCPYCIGSALFSLTLLGLALFGRRWEDIGQVLFIGFIVVLVTIMGTLGIYAHLNNPLAEGDRAPIPTITEQPKEGIGWEITTTSGASEIALAEHLTKIGAKEYGAWWCPHCNEQKLLFGKEAFQKVTYVECDPKGQNPQPEACQAAQIQSFPTWEINGTLYKGARPLEELAKLSGYEGPQNFRYFIPGR